MNQINFKHIGLAIFMQLIIGLITNDWFAGACFGSAFYIGREITQAEYRIIQSKYEGKRDNMPWYGGFLKDAWTLKGLFDFLLPMFAVSFICIISYLI